jgi:hypothetical protein
VFNSEIPLGQPEDDIQAVDFAKHLTGYDEYLDVRMTNSSMDFETFYDFAFLYGRANRPEFPYMYGAY